MNNAKVRIYELSKELNLDNKELLAICDQLNIAVKSHSSTITESEAELIRAEAEKLGTMNRPRKDHTANSHKPNSSQPGGRNRPAAPNKQQILEIRKPTVLKSPNSSAPEASSVTNNPLASSEASLSSPPRPLATPVSPMKPTAPTRPVPRNLSETPEKPPVTDADQTATANNNPPVAKTPKPEVTASGKPNRSEKPQKPQLSAPPARPLTETEQEQEQPQQPLASATLSVSEKPILKRDRDQREQPKGKGNKPNPGELPSGAPPQKPVRSSAGAPTKSEGRVSRPAPVGGGDVQRPSRPGRPQPASASAPIAMSPRPVLVAPVRPEATTSVPDDDDTPDTEVIELKRPTPPRLAKGGKKWQEEEIDELKDKAAKAAPKGKRLKPIVDDFEDEDFLDDEDDDAPSITQVSNAIVRPPKPKAAKPSQPIMASAPTTRKKPSAPRDKNNRHNNNNRESTEQKRERPEVLMVTGPMTVQELADGLVIADTEIVKILFIKGLAVSITHNLDIPTITMVAKELEVEVETQEPEAEARKVTEMIDVADLEYLHRRPPVVTIMGHVDHGKTTLLDSIRKTKVAAGEAGGITQHIGAYHVDIEHGGKEQQIVFLDTPGHEAFTAMRARGARVTDIAILVVAADDGVRPQTVEAISHAQAAGVPIVVAINKIDKESAQPDRVKQELTQYGLTPEEWGGDTIMVPVSAIRGENLDTLLEMILLVAEVAELSANPDRLARGTVIEAHLDKAKGAVATLLIQNGTLHVGDLLVAGPVFGKVRAMVDDRGKRVDVASPSFAVEVLGLSDVPAAGDEFEVFAVEKEARNLAAKRAEKQRQSRLMQGRVTLTSISAQAQEGELKELNLILKSDVQGSLEAIVGALRQIPQNEVQIRMLLSAAGEITQTDIDLAAASGAVIIGFNTTYASGARSAADEAGVDVREYDIIYKLLEDIQGALEGLLEPELVEEPLGQAEVRAVFPVGRGAVAGCYVQNGKLLRNCRIRVRRGGKVLYEGGLDSLKRMKEDSKEVNTGFECGVGVDRFNDWVEGDIIEAFQMVTKRRSLTLTR
ncbi:translation initiation factor IF-2 [Calothrix sp. 336/3]|uniref:translation initiation factor IF-2 n=1 Tax=Calothrix sp. 336/3 TaxID=1337936 RepID=UPI0004E352AB|nr:translation initiation factor IF-2 [Calothrix sp. 336/3]AKG23212.1 translation initiation factor IF-2 [Calothrix sp. 336/3]